MSSTTTCQVRQTLWQLTWPTLKMQLVPNPLSVKSGPKNLSGYVSQTKKQWMTLEVINPGYAGQYTAALSQLDTAIARAKDTEKQTLLAARIKLEEFNGLKLADKNTVQRRLRAMQFSGHAMIDDWITSFTIFPEYINDLKVSDTERTALQKAATASLEAKSIESIAVRASERISKCKATLKDTRANPFDTAADLSLLTGRRCIEILKTAQFTPVSDHSVLFSGQAKKGDLLDPVAYEIPVLATPNLINTALGRLRAAKNCSSLTNRDVNLKYANSCNAAARRLLGKEHHFHSLRGIYAVIAHHSCLPHKYSLNAFVAKVLGHSSLGTSLHYSAIHVEHLKKKHKFIWSATEPTLLRVAGSSSGIY
jgi:integrase